MADMGLPLAYGAGVASDELARIIQQQLLIQEQQRREAEDAAQAQYQQGMLGVAGDRNAIEREQMAAQAPERAARVRGLTATTAKTEQDIAQAQADAAQEAELLKDPKLGPMFRARKAGAAPFDTQLEDKQRQEMDRLKYNRGTQWGAIDRANQARTDTPNLRILTPRKITDANGQQIVRVEAIDETTGQTVWVKDERSNRTADVTNRMEFIRQFSQMLPRLQQVSLGGPASPTGGRAAKGLNTTYGIWQVGQGYLNWAKAKTGYQDDAREYESNIDGLAFLAARVMGSNSQLSDAERAAARSLFPTLTDTAQVAKRKWEYWDRIYQAATSGNMDDYSTARASVRALLGSKGVPLDKDPQPEGMIPTPTTGVTVAPGGYANSGSVQW